MKKIAIACDSTSDLTPELIKNNDIYIMPLQVVFNEHAFSDGVDLDAEKLYQKVEEFNMLPKTSAVSVETFKEFYKKILTEYDQIIMIPIGIHFSSTNQNANIAAKEFPEGTICVHDSASLSTGIGLQVMKACKLRDQGKSMKEIIAELERIRPLVHTSFAIEKMDYLRKGGRCSGLAYVVGNVLRIKPIIVVRDGKMIVGTKRMGHFSKALDYLIEQVLLHKDNLDDDYVFITHSLAFEHEKYIRARIEKELNVKVIVSAIAGSVISSHCGRGTIGILYITKD